MIVTGLDGRAHHWPPRRKRPRERASGPHRAARALLASLFPAELVYEEVPIPGSRLSADFYLPSSRLMVEVQGRQHREHVGLFHRDQAGSQRARHNDGRKREFCSLNEIRFVELHDDRTDEWPGLLA